MLAFVTSLRHPQNSADYRRVEDLLQSTLASVLNQTSLEFVVIVVGNRAPAFELPDRVHFVPVDFDPPAPPDGPRTAREPFVRDKGSKIGVGLLFAKQFDPDYIMIFDADDFVSRSLTQWVSERPGRDGWYIDRGYMFSSRRQSFQDQNGFNKTCGTCMLIAPRLYSIPEDLAVDAPQEAVISAYGSTLWRVLGAHRDGVEWFTEQGASLQALPFRGAVYHVGTGENHSGKDMTGMARPVSSRFVAEFGVPAQPNSARALWGAAGPLPLAQTARALTRRAARWVRQRRDPRSGTGG